MNPRLPLLALSGMALLGLTACAAEVPDAPGTTPAAPSSTSAASTAPAATTVATPAAASSRPAGDGCPVTAAALQKGVKTLPEGWRIEASSIECSHGWAQAAVIAPTPEQQGDGVVLFSYDATADRWVEKGQGSSVDCGAFGIPKKAGRNLPVCYYPS